MQVRLKIFLVILVCIVASICVMLSVKSLNSNSRRPYLTVIGPVKMGDGIGRQSVELLHALQQEVSVGFVPTHTPCLTDVPQEVYGLITHPNSRLGHVVVYEAPLPMPNHKIDAKVSEHLQGEKKDDQLRIAYSMYEYSAIPSEWARVLNTYFDAVAVPDEFLVNVYQNSGVTLPIFVLPLGLEIDPFLEAPLKQQKNVPFCFINTSSMISRKNPEGLIRAFHQAFGTSPEVRLLINYRYTAGDALEKVTTLLNSLQADNIILKNEHFDNKDYLNFLQKGDVFVSLSKGEGFSIQPREAMALGLPVLISDNTAHKTIIKSGLACAISCPTTEAAYNPFLKCTCGEGYLVDIAEAAHALRAIYEHYEETLIDARQRREWVKQYRYENLRPLYLSLLRPKQVILGDRNEITEEALITSSATLYKKYQLLPK